MQEGQTVPAGQNSLSQSQGDRAKTPHEFADATPVRGRKSICRLPALPHTLMFRTAPRRSRRDGAPSLESCYG